MEKKIKFLFVSSILIVIIAILVINILIKRYEKEVTVAPSQGVIAPKTELIEQLPKQRQVDTGKEKEEAPEKMPAPVFPKEPMLN